MQYINVIYEYISSDPLLYGNGHYVARLGPSISFQTTWDIQNGVLQRMWGLQSQVIYKVPALFTYKYHWALIT